MPLLEDLRVFLLAQPGLIDSDWKIYIGYFPDDQDQMIAVFETGGMPPDTLGRENERLTFQLRVRGKRLDYHTVWLKWKAVFNALQDSRPTTDYAFVQTMHDGPLAFNDDKGRTNMTSNFRVMKKRV